jgi:pimeloyl-ACP methyl ester carboxylesterase
LFVSTFGRGQRTILCLHGIEAHGLRFFGLARLLPEATIVAPDLRGHGNSPKEGPWTIDQHMRDLLPLLESLGPQTFVLGHSYGGLIALVAPAAVDAGWEQMTAPLQPTDYRGPTLLLEAARENGAYVSPAVVEGMRRQLGDRLQHVILDTAHTIPSDHPDLLAEHVRAFRRA